MEKPPANAFNNRISFAVTARMLTAIEKHGEQTGMSLSQTIRQAVFEFLARKRRNASSGVKKATEKQRARGWPMAQVKKALKNGQLKKEPCRVCGKTDGVEGHHEDYSKPLQIDWLCKNHHTELHREKRKENCDRKSVDDIWGI